MALPAKDGLQDTTIENGRSRVWFGMRWVFDAFAVIVDHKHNSKRIHQPQTRGYSMVVSNNRFEAA